MTTKKIMIAAALLGSALIPLTVFAWHGGPGPCYGPGPGYGPDFGPGDGPRYHHRWDGPRHDWHNRHLYRHGARTFGMDEVQARDFMRDVGSVLQIKPAQQKAWDAMVQAYADLAKCRHEHWRVQRGDAPMSQQEYLQARSQFMHSHLQAFDAYVAALANLEKALDKDQMADFNELVATGSLLDRGPRGPRGAAPERPAAKPAANS